MSTMRFTDMKRGQLIGYNRYLLLGEPALAQDGEVLAINISKGHQDIALILLLG